MAMAMALTFGNMNRSLRKQRNDSILGKTTSKPTKSVKPVKPVILTKLTYTVSNCCGANIIGETDLCSDCKEHCEIIYEDEE